MIIDGKSHSEKLRKKIKDELTKICQNTKDVPKLSVILIGDYLPSQIYVKNKQKKAKEVGIKSEVIKYPETVSEKEVLDIIYKWAALESDLDAQSELIRDDRVMITSKRWPNQADNLMVQKERRAYF